MVLLIFHLGDNSLKNTNNLKTIVQNQIQYNSIDYINHGFKIILAFILKTEILLQKMIQFIHQTSNRWF